MREIRNGTAASLVLTLAMAAAPAWADGPDYTYAEAGYFDLEFDDVDVFDLDGDGFYLGGSAAVTEMVHLFADYGDGEIDVQNTALDADYTSLEFGAGINWRVAEGVDLVGRLAYVNAEVDVGGGNDVDEDGYALGAGARALLSPRLELNAGLSYTDLGGDFDAETALHVGGVFNFTDALAASAGLVVSDDATEFRIGGRWYPAR